MVEDYDLLLLEVGYLFDWFGNIYLGLDGQDWDDNVICFGVLCKVVVDVVDSGVIGWKLDIVYVYDWQVGFVFFYLKECGCDVFCVVLIYNVVF